MKKSIKSLIKLTVLVIVFYVYCWIVGYWYDHYNYFTLWLDSLVAMVMFFPILAIYALRLRRGKEIGKFRSVFNVIAWVLIFRFLIFIIYEVWDLFLLPRNPDLGILKTLWFNIKYYIHPDYFFSLDYGFLYDLSSILHSCWPYFIVIALLYWMIRINNKLEVKFKKHENI